MAAERLSMRKISEVLRLKAAGHSQRAIAGSLSISHSTVGDYLARARLAGITWPLQADCTEAALQARLFPAAPGSRVTRPLPDWPTVHQEMARRKRSGVTLQLLWMEYREGAPDGLQYSQYCQLYRQWRRRLDRVLRHEHVPGEKVFVDFAGQTVPVVDRGTGEIRQAQVFVATLGASNYSYAKACWTQALPDWLALHAHLYAFLGGVPRITVPDNLKAGVAKACYYEPDLNPAYADLAEHYGTAVLPARILKPRDKAKVEAGVQLVERWILARLRKLTFFTLAELNDDIHRLLEHLNNHPFQKLPGCRRSVYEQLDRPALQPLPAHPYEWCDWRHARVNIDYHIEVHGHYYSVPHRLVREAVDVRLTPTMVEVLHGHQRVALHRRSHNQGGFTTDPAHRPKAHQEHLAWPPTRLIAWAERSGPHVGQLVRRLLESKRHPEQGYRPAMGLLRLGDDYGLDRLNAACERALLLATPSYRSVKSILAHDFDRLPLTVPAPLSLPQDHANLRGNAYYADATAGDAP